MVLAIPAILVAAAVSDSLGDVRAWTLVTAVVVGYMLSRDWRRPARLTWVVRIFSVAVILFEALIARPERGHVSPAAPTRPGLASSRLARVDDSAPVARARL